MEQFKKWYSKTYGMSPTFKEEASWREALKWIKYEGVLSYDLAGTLIDEELGDE